ncbi:hypothetical protein SS50377_22032 [Spironucleus salmonicida]|uniref:Uncharacterized protein n=1 Tax=Spironucleus salmonicida TaxID=348837 RepID=V6LNI6_9EUKA|nr:hypothetical protein SS50377_22032 [Spironucleus salmonicida]|eukprot:EST45803.1 Hypothetical protein SS50377_14377 [Spironucleus salmonicida]
MYHKAPIQLPKVVVLNNETVSQTKKLVLVGTNNFSPSQKPTQLVIQPQKQQILYPDFQGTLHKPLEQIRQIHQNTIKLKIDEQKDSLFVQTQKLIIDQNQSSQVTEKQFQFIVKPSQKQQVKQPTQQQTQNNPQQQFIKHLFLKDIVNKPHNLQCQIQSGVVSRRLVDYISKNFDQNFCIQSKKLPGNETLQKIQMKNQASWIISQKIFGQFQSSLRKMQLQQLIETSNLLVDSIMLTNIITQLFLVQDYYFDDSVNDNIIRAFGKLLQLNFFDLVHLRLIEFDFNVDCQKFEYLIKMYAIYMTFSNEIRGKIGINVQKLCQQQLKIYLSQCKKITPMIFIYLSLISRLNYQCAQIIFNLLSDKLETLLKIQENPIEYSADKVRQAYEDQVVDLSDDAGDCQDAYYVQQSEKSLLINKIGKYNPNQTNYDPAIQVILQRNINSLKGKEYINQRLHFNNQDIICFIIYTLQQSLFAVLQLLVQYNSVTGLYQQSNLQIMKQCQCSVLKLTNFVERALKFCNTFIFKVTEHDKYFIELLNKISEDAVYAELQILVPFTTDKLYLQNLLQVLLTMSE